MTPELDFDLTPEQWEAMKALRRPVSERRALRRSAVQRLVELQLAVLVDETPLLTPLGRSVLIRGSCSLLDMVA